MARLKRVMVRASGKKIKMQGPCGEYHGNMPCRGKMYFSGVAEGQHILVCSECLKMKAIPAVN